MAVLAGTGLLGIDTASAKASVALLGDDGVVWQRQSQESQKHAEQLLSLVESCLADACQATTGLHRVAVGIGPGSFTGLRVGIALAQGLALGLGIEIVGVSSLWAMAAAASHEARGRVLVPLMDARRGEVFAAAYDEAGQMRLAPVAVPYALVRSTVELALGGLPYVGVGAISVELLGEHATATASRSDGPDAAWVARIGRAGRADEEVLPLYARSPDAVLPNLRKNPLAPG